MRFSFEATRVLCLALFDSKAFDPIRSFFPPRTSPEGKRRLQCAYMPDETISVGILA